MTEFTTDELVQLGLERALVSDAVAREKKKKRQETAILPVFMGKNGKVRQLGQNESNALVLPNRYYQEGEPMNPQPVGKGGLIAVDNKSYFAPPVVPPVVEPPPEPTGKKFEVYLEIGINLYMFTGFASTVDSFDLTTSIPYDQDNILLLADYEEELATNPPSSTTLSDLIEVSPGIEISTEFGTTTISQISGYENPYQAFSLIINCQSNYLVEFYATLRQQATGGSGYFYTPDVVAETWLANSVGDFELVNTLTAQMPGAGDPSTPPNLMPFTFSDGANNGAVLGCDIPETLTYTFFVRFKNPSKTNWFEL